MEITNTSFITAQNRIVMANCMSPFLCQRLTMACTFATPVTQRLKRKRSHFFCIVMGGATFVAPRDKLPRK